MEANKESNMESSTASLHRGIDSKIKSSQENIHAVDQDVSNIIKKSNLDATDNVDCNIGMEERGDTKVRKLERVETDDCTSIDTSTLPPPPDEILFNSQDGLGESKIEERFIA